MCRGAKIALLQVVRVPREGLSKQCTFGLCLFNVGEREKIKNIERNIKNSKNNCVLGWLGKFGFC